MNDPVIINIEHALNELARLQASRERSIVKTKLEEGLLWYQYGSRLPEDQGW